MRAAKNKKWEKIKKEILGERYELSVVYAPEGIMRKLSRKYRKKDKAPNVLSFPLSKEMGEIFISRERAVREAKKLGISQKAYLDYLFIHSLLHLKGMRHGRAMKEEEKKFLKKHKINISI